MPEMLSVRRTKQLVSDLARCRKLLRRLGITSTEGSTDSSIVRVAVETYARVLEAEAQAKGKVRR